MKKIKEIILLGALMISGTALADLKTGLVAHYSFDDCTAKDVSGKGHDGVLNGNISCVDGIVNKGLLFDGVDSYIDINVPLVGTENWSVCAWINIANIDSAYTDWQSIVTAVNGAGREVTELGFPTASKAFNIYPDVSAKSGTAVVKKDTLMCFTKKAGNLSIFKNGVKIAGGAGSADFVALKTIGMWQPLESSPYDKEPFNGVIDEVRAYKRTLSASEISEMYRVTIDVQGGVYGYKFFSVECNNKTTGQIVSISQSIKDFNCETEGLVINSGDVVDVTISGTAH